MATTVQGQARVESVYEESSATQTRMYDALNTVNAQQAHAANQQATQHRMANDGAQQGMAPYSSVRLSEHTNRITFLAATCVHDVRCLM